MPLIIYTSDTTDTVASKNIAEHLKELGAGELLFDSRVRKILDIPTNFKTDYLIVASPHRSERSIQTLTAHIPGNWNKSDCGGKERVLNIAYASKLKLILQKLAEGNEKYGLGWHVNLEVDHHGPTCDIPIIFTEIGSTPKEWENETAGRIVAEAIIHAVKTDKTFPAYVGVGGGHYAPKFTEIVLKSEKAIGHILPKYHADALGEDTFKQAIEKNVEKIEGILVDKKGINARQTEMVKQLAAKYGIKITEV